MPTFRRGRNNKSELNLTSSFMAGGSLYQHHSGSLLAFYRFEEPYEVNLSQSHSLRVEDSSGHGYYGLVSSGSMPDYQERLLEGKPTPTRTAITSPYSFNNPLKSEDVLGGAVSILAVSPKDSNQLRCVDFGSGSSERIELPRQLARDLSSIPGRPFPHRETYESGMTFAGWVKMHPVTGSYSIDVQAKASGYIYLATDHRSHLHAETIILRDTAGNIVTFTYDEYSGGNVRNSPTSYTVGLGSYSSYVQGADVASAVYSAINLAYGNGDLNIKPSYTYNDTEYIKVVLADQGGGGQARARITFRKVPALNSTITLISHRGKSVVYTAKASETLASNQFAVVNAGSTTAADIQAALDSLRSCIANSSGHGVFPHSLAPSIRSGLRIIIGTGEADGGTTNKGKLPSDGAKYTIVLTQGNNTYNLILYFKNDGATSLAGTQLSDKPSFGNVTETQWRAGMTDPTAGSLGSNTVQLNLDVSYDDSNGYLTDSHYDYRIANYLYYAFYKLVYTTGGINGVDISASTISQYFSWETQGNSYGPTGRRNISWLGPDGAAANATTATRASWAVTQNTADSNSAINFIVQNFEAATPSIDLTQYRSGPLGNTTITIAGDSGSAIEVKGAGHRDDHHTEIPGTQYNSATGSASSGAVAFTGGRSHRWAGKLKTTGVDKGKANTDSSGQKYYSGNELSVNWGRVGLKQTLGGDDGNTTPAGTAFHEEGYRASGGSNFFDTEDLSALSNYKLSSQTLTVVSVPAWAETLIVTTKNHYEESQTFTITFTSAGGTSDTKWASDSGLYPFSDGAQTATIHLGSKSVNDIAAEIKSILHSMPFHDATVTDAVVTLSATAVSEVFNFTSTGTSINNGKITTVKPVGAAGALITITTASMNIGPLEGGAGDIRGGKSVVKNKFIAKSIFTALTGAYSDPHDYIGGGAVDKTDGTHVRGGGEDATGLSLRVLSKPGTDKHNTLSWLSTHYSGSSAVTEQSEWRTSKPLPEDVWTHVAVVYPTGSNINEYGLHSSDLKDESSPIAPKMFINGRRQDLRKIPRAEPSKGHVTFKTSPDTGYALHAVAQATGSLRHVYIRYDTTSSPPWRQNIAGLVPTASISVVSGAYSTAATLANHLATWSVNVPGQTGPWPYGQGDATANFLVDTVHSGSTNVGSAIFEDGSENRVQKVSPNYDDLARVHIRYGGLFSNTGSNPEPGQFLRITTPNLTTKTYRFSGAKASTTIDCNNRTAAQLANHTLTLIDNAQIVSGTVIFTYTALVGDSTGYGNISGITKASPAVVTTAENHGLSDGHQIWITDVVGMTELNNKKYYIDVISATTFGLYTTPYDGTTFTSPVDSTDFTTYGSSGGVSKAAANSTSSAYTVDVSGVKSAASLTLLLHEAILLARYNGDLMINSTRNDADTIGLTQVNIGHGGAGASAAKLGNTAVVIGGSGGDATTHEDFSGGLQPEFATATRALSKSSAQKSVLTALHSTSSLSNYFKIGTQTNVGAALTAQPAYSFVRSDMNRIMTGTYETGMLDPRTGGYYNKGAAMGTIPQAQPILLFATPSEPSTNAAWAVRFGSERYIQCTEKFTSDCWVQFKAWPGSQSGEAQQTIHSSMRERPDTDEGIHVQIGIPDNASPPVITWYSPEYSVQGYSGASVTTLLAGTNRTHGIKHYVSGTGPQSVETSGGPVYDRHDEQKWRHYSFYCNWAKINAGLLGGNGGPAGGYQSGYYVRIIQRGYSGWNYDQWALCDITLQGVTANYFQNTSGVVDVPIANDIDGTWANLITSITGTNGHGSEIIGTQDTDNNIVTLTLKSPIGRINSTTSAGLMLTASSTAQGNTDDSISLQYGLHPHSSVRIENFGLSGNETHWRLGVKGVSSIDDYRAAIKWGLDYSNISGSQSTGDDSSANILTVSSANIAAPIPITSPIQNSKFGSPTTGSTGWSVLGWADLAGRTIPIGDISGITSGSSTAAVINKVAARTAEVINMMYITGTIGVKALPSSSLGSTVTLEQAVPGITTTAAKIEAVDSAYKAVTLSSWLQTNSSAASGGYFPSTDAFSGGFRTFQAPRGPLVPVDAMYLGTPPQLLNYFAKKSYPYGFDYPAGSTLTNFTHHLAGRSPRAAFDDIAFWGRCLTDEEINALYGAKDGTFTPKSGFMSHPPRVTIREHDALNHQYPTISRFGDSDFTGRYNLFYDASNEQIFHDPYAKAEILFKGRPRDGTWIQLVDWAGRTKRFEFNYGTIVSKGNIEVAIHNDRTPAQVAKTLVAVINSCSGFGIKADISNKKEAVLLKQTKAGTEGNTLIKNSRKNARPKLRRKIRAIIPGKFIGGTASPKVVFPYRLEPGHRTIRSSQPTPNAVPDMLVSGSAHKNILTEPIKHYWKDESISPFDESYRYAAFGSEMHADSDDFFTTDTEKDQEFYSTGTLPSLVGLGLHGPLWSKRKIEIDIAPKKSTTLHGHIVTGSSMAYFNFEKKAWEPIGFPGTGSYWQPQGARPIVDNAAVTVGYDPSWSHLSSSLVQASVYSVSASSIDGEPASYSGFRQWLDKTYIGFSPSIGMMVAKSEGSVAGAQAPNANNQGKYVFVDGGISTPVSTFGFPFHAKFHATSSQYLNASDYIDRPFLLEKIVYEFEASVHQSSSIDIRTGGSGSVGTGSYGSAGGYNQHAYINSPTPTFFMLNQRTACLPDAISNKVDVITVVDGAKRPQDFHYTASIPSKFYLAPPAKTDEPQYIDTIRDLVTFGRYGVFTSGFDEQDFESYVPDPRARLDTVIVPHESRQGNFAIEPLHAGSKRRRMSLAMPVRSPKVNPSITTFKAEGDFFGNTQAGCVLAFTSSLPYAGQTLTITDTTQDSVTFRFDAINMLTGTEGSAYAFNSAADGPIKWNTNISQWTINIGGLSTTDDLKTITSMLYETIARAARGEASTPAGNFTSGISLGTTGSTNALSFTMSQKRGGIEGNTTTRVNYNGLPAGGGDGSNNSWSCTNFSGGDNLNDDIVLSWGGGRSGTGLMSGRAPFGGEYGAFDLSYSVNNNTQTYVVSQSAEDSLVSPYLIMPGDKLVFGWQTPIGTGSMVHHAITEPSGTFEIHKGVGKIVLYGSVLRDEKEEFVNTSNQPLTSNSIHEALHFGAEVFDQYDTDPPMFHSGTYLDNHVTGAMLRGISKDTFGTLAHISSHRKVVSRHSSGNHALGPKSNTARIYQKRSGFLRGVRVADSRERWYDSMLPDISDLLKIDQKRLFSPSFGTHGNITNTRGAALVLGHPKVATGSNTDISPNDQVWSAWFGAFPFEPRYSSATRTAGLKTKDVFAPSASGSVDTGTKQLVHVWLANITGSITVPGLGGPAATFGSVTPNISTISTDMLNIIDHPGLLKDAANQAGSDGLPDPNFSSYAIITNDHGHGKTGEHLAEIQFGGYNNPVYGSLFEDNANFFAKVLFGSGDGSYKFPKLPFWKSTGMNEVGYGADDTFVVTKGVIIRGFRYGLANVLPKFSSAVYRRDNFGHIRDMLEQRNFTRFFTEDGLEEGVVSVSFVERGSNGARATDPMSTNSANLDIFCSSSMPYRDGHALDRISQQPDTAEKVSIAIDIGLD